MAADHGLPGLQRALADYGVLQGINLAVGIHGSSGLTAAGDATPTELVTIATANEYGTASIPARPFLRHAARVSRAAWVARFRLIVGAVHRPLSERAMLIRRLGVVMTSDVQTSIRTGPWVPNAPSTIRRKGSSLPLVNTGQLVGSVRTVATAPGMPDEVVG